MLLLILILVIIIAINKPEFVVLCLAFWAHDWEQLSAFIGVVSGVFVAVNSRRRGVVSHMRMPRRHGHFNEKERV